MQPIQINVQVQVGLDSALSALIAPLISNLQAGQPTAAPAPVAEQKPATRKKAATATKPAEVEQPAADPAPVETEQPAADPAPADQPAATSDNGAKEYSEVDVRAAMDRTRKRIEGESYKEKPDSEGYKTWHRVLTAWFKNEAAVLGAEKPSALPDSESRRKFIEACDAVIVKDGELTEECPY